VCSRSRATKTALLDAWAGAALAIVIDAVRSGAPPGTIHRVDLDARPPAAALRLGSTHAVGLAEAIELGRALDRLPVRLALYGIEGARFETGAGLTPAVARAVETLCQRLSRAGLAAR
jgi:hydrogenase maturation protease